MKKEVEDNLEYIADKSEEEVDTKYRQNSMQNELEKYFDDSQYNFFDLSDYNDKVEDAPISYDEAEEKMKITKNTADEFIKNAKSDRRWKGIYAFFLLAMLIIQIFWLNGLFLKVGQGVLIYNESTFNIYITASLIEVIAIVKLVVKHLFHDNISASFKNVFDQFKETNKKNK